MLGAGVKGISELNDSEFKYADRGSDGHLRKLVCILILSYSLLQQMSLL